MLLHDGDELWMSETTFVIHFELKAPQNDESISIDKVD